MAERGPGRERLEGLNERGGLPCRPVCGIVKEESVYTKKLKNTPVVYFISDGNGFVKIGYAADIFQRFNAMQVNNAAELKILHLVYDEDLDDIHWLEKQYHEQLKPFRVRGEWYAEKPVIEYLEAEKKQIEDLGHTQDFEEENRIFQEMESVFHEFLEFVKAGGCNL